MLSPLQTIVPYDFVMWDALKTVWSILTALLSKRAAIALSADPTGSISLISLILRFTVFAGLSMPLSYQYI
jgi:hypothetical protein